MKTKLLLIGLVSLSVSSQLLAQTFLRTLGTTGDEYVSSLQKTSDGGFVVAGYTNGSGAGGQDILLIKLDASGVVQWAKTSGLAGDDIAYSVRQTSDGGYIVSGSTDAGTGVGQFLLSKFDSTGTFQWANTLGDGFDSGAAFSVQQTTDGGYIATGFPHGGAGGLGLVKYDSSGTLQWLQETPGPNHYGMSVQQTTDGGFIVAGSVQVAGIQYDASLLKFDGSGNLQWAQSAGGAANEQANAVRQTADGGYIVAGFTGSAGAGGQDVLLLKYNNTGTLQWARTGGGTGDDAADSVQQTSDGGYIVSGHTNSFGSQNQNVLLLKYDNSGTLLWARSGGGSTGNTSVQQTADGGYLLAASTASFGAGGSDVLLIKTDANGNIGGCANWSAVTPSVNATFQSNPTTYSLDSTPFSIGAPNFATASAPLASNDVCTAVGGKRVFVSWTAGQVLQFVLLKETNTITNTSVKFAIANLQPAWYDVAVSTVGDVRGTLPVSFLLGPSGVKADFPTITFSPGARLRFTADRTTNRALIMLGIDFFWRAVSGSAFPVTESDRAIIFLGSQDQASAMLLQIGRDIKTMTSPP